MPLTLPVSTVAECLRTDCYILGDKKKQDGDQRNTAANMIRPLGMIFSLVFKANTEKISTVLSGEDFVFRSKRCRSETFESRGGKSNIYLE